MQNRFSGFPYIFISLFLLVWASCTTEVTKESDQLSFKLADSLKNYSTVLITLIDDKDSTKILDTAFIGTLADPKSIPPYTLAKEIGKNFRIRIQGFNAQGVLALESNIQVKEGVAAAPIKTAPENLPSWIPKRGSTRLTNLEISVGELSPAFDPEVFQYTVEAAFRDTVLTLNASALDTQALLQLNGNSLLSGIPTAPSPLIVGINEFSISIKAKGEELPGVYRLTIRRASGAEARLDSLVLSSGQWTQAFHTDSVNYDIVVEENLTRLRVSPFIKDKKAKVGVAGYFLDLENGALVDLNEGGVTRIEVFVTAENGTTEKQYILNVVHAKSSDATLATLLIQDGNKREAFLSPNFDPQIEHYKVMISTDQLLIRASSQEAEAKLLINKEIPKDGLYALLPDSILTDFSIEVLAPDGKTKRTYTLTAAQPSTNALLKSLAFSGAKLDSAFKESRFNYTAIMDTGRPRINLICQPLTNSKGMDVMVNGINITKSNLTSPVDTFNLPLVFGENTISVEVTSQDGKNKNFYLIRLTRNANAIVNLTTLSLSKGIMRPLFHTDSLIYRDTVLDADTSIGLTAKVKDSASIMIIRNLKQLGVDTGTTDKSPLNPIIKVPSLIPVVPPISKVRWDTVRVDTLKIPVDKKNMKLETGMNLLEVEVLGENRSVKKTYRIYVYRKLSNISVLSAITLKSGKETVPLSPTFTSTGVLYSATTTSTFITLTPLAFEATATITVNGFSVNSGTPSASMTLQPGLNTITVVCTAPDTIGKSTYTIRILK